ncbi:MAG: metallophosphoesterase [candidate division Zixibacteria bacterium]|nr:metallophosphoesterase [candidate division Zixibacteria bacterium]
MSFFLIVITVLSLMYGYIGWRLIVPAAFSLPVTILLWVLLAVLLVLPVVPTGLQMRGYQGTGVEIIAWIAFLSFGFLTLLFAILLTKDLFVILATAAQKTMHFVEHVFNGGSASVNQVDPSRRQLITNWVHLGILGATAALTGYGIFEALRAPKVVEVTIPIDNLPDDLDGLRIVQITDIHVSHTVRRSFVQSVTDTVNALSPDLIVLTGDLADGPVRQLRDEVAPLADLRAPLGSFFVTGNHEYYSGVKEWIEETARLGFTVLLNEHKVIERGSAQLLLAGVTDSGGGQFDREHISDPQKAQSGAPTCHAKVLLAHQPRSIFAAAQAGYDYVISGHTHGGQYFPYHFLAALTQPYISGLHEHGNTRIYVSRGTGYWGPQMRIGARSEITVHRLTSA